MLVSPCCEAAVAVVELPDPVVELCSLWGLATVVRLLAPLLLLSCSCACRSPSWRQCCLGLSCGAGAGLVLPCCLIPAGLPGGCCAAAVATVTVVLLCGRHAAWQPLCDWVRWVGARMPPGCSRAAVVAVMRLLLLSYYRHGCVNFVILPCGEEVQHGLYSGQWAHWSGSLTEDACTTALGFDQVLMVFPPSLKYCTPPASLGSFLITRNGTGPSLYGHTSHKCARCATCHNGQCSASTHCP